MRMPLHEMNRPWLSLVHTLLDSAPEHADVGRSPKFFGISVCNRSKLMVLDSLSIRRELTSNPRRSFGLLRPSLDDIPVSFEVFRSQRSARDARRAKGGDHRFETAQWPIVGCCSDLMLGTRWPSRGFGYSYLCNGSSGLKEIDSSFGKRVGDLAKLAR
jgi:hypothetical protein